MGFSSRSHYGTRAMLELALRAGDGPVDLDTLAGVQRIPARYLAKIVQELRRAGLIRSVRGAGGGYMLARPAAEICVLEIVQYLDGSVAFTECVDRPELCKNARACVLREVWTRVQDATVDVLSSVTLQDLVDRSRKNGRSGARRGSGGGL